MEQFLSEWLYLIVFGAIIAFNLLTQLRERMRANLPPNLPEQTPATGSTESLSPVVEEPPPPEAWGRSPEVLRERSRVPTPALRVRDSAPSPAPQARARRRHPIRSILDNRRELQRAVVLSMVLGPRSGVQQDERNVAR